MNIEDEIQALSSKNAQEQAQAREAFHNIGPADLTEMVSICQKRALAFKKLKQFIFLYPVILSYSLVGYFFYVVGFQHQRPQLETALGLILLAICAIASMPVRLRWYQKQRLQPAAEALLCIEQPSLELVTGLYDVMDASYLLSFTMRLFYSLARLLPKLGSDELGMFSSLPKARRSRPLTVLTVLWRGISLAALRYPTSVEQSESVADLMMTLARINPEYAVSKLTALLSMSKRRHLRSAGQDLLQEAARTVLSELQHPI